MTFQKFKYAANVRILNLALPINIAFVCLRNIHVASIPFVELGLQVGNILLELEYLSR